MTLEYLEMMLRKARKLGAKGDDLVLVKVGSSVIHDLAHFADSANIDDVTVECLAGQTSVTIQCGEKD